MNQRLLNITWSQFLERKLRSALTVLGIVIGITALVSLILLSNGLKQGITGQLDSFGADEILLSPKSTTSPHGPTGFGPLTTDDIKVLKSIPQIVSVDSILSSSLEVSYGREKMRLTVSGVGNEYGRTERTFEDYFDQELSKGRYIKKGNVKEVNIGYRIAYETFDKDVHLGSTLIIDGDKYKVVGIFEEQGSITEDTAIYAPIESFRNTLGDSKALTAIAAKVSPGVDIDVMVEKIKIKLKRYRGSDDINVITPKEIQEKIGSLLGVIDLIVISIALISLFVGALGIMNSMYTSVLQRVREIGIMKAVGAKNSQILILFVIESAILGFFGGIVGVIIGIGMAYGFIEIINSFGFFKIVLVSDITLFAGAIAFSTILGILSGFLPALKASRLKVIDALRYE